METAGPAFETFKKDTYVVLVQEHWYFDCQLHRLNSVSSDFIGRGKAVDTGDPILPLQMPRGYGGTAVLWKRGIDHLIVVLPDGGNRIQCVELRGAEPVLIISVYVPCKGLQGCVENYEDTLTQLNEIVIKYSESHRIIIGGDFNEDITEPNNSKRSLLLQQFLTESKMSYESVGKTYINPNGVETSTIDYIFYDQTMKNLVLSITRLEALHANVSDHIPVCCTFKYSLQQFLESSEKPALQSKPKWDKIDKTRYQTMVTTKLMEVLNAGPCALDIQVRQINDALVQAAEEVRPKTVKRHRKARLNVWTQEIKEALSAKKKAFWEWKQNNRPNHEGNVFVTNKKLTTRYLRKLCRMESANVRGAARQQILDARTSDT